MDTLQHCNCNLYQRFLDEREEILKHKWIESEKQGYDTGFEKALLDWMYKHRKNWMKSVTYTCKCK